MGTEHASGFETFTPSASTLANPNGYVIIEASDIRFPVHFAPDFSTAIENGKEPKEYKRYLLNHDANRLTWARGNGKRKELPKNPDSIYTWEDVKLVRQRIMEIDEESRFEEEEGGTDSDETGEDDSDGESMDEISEDDDDDE